MIVFIPWVEESTIHYLYLNLQMAKYFNEKSSLPGDIPLGGFNAMFNFSGSWQLDAAATKSLAMVGIIVPLFSVELADANLILRDEVKRAVPYSWDPAALARWSINQSRFIWFPSSVMSILEILEYEFVCYICC